MNTKLNCHPLIRINQQKRIHLYRKMEFLPKKEHTMGDAASSTRHNPSRCKSSIIGPERVILNSYVFLQEEVMVIGKIIMLTRKQWKKIPRRTIISLMYLYGLRDLVMRRIGVPFCKTRNQYFNKFQ